MKKSIILVCMFLLCSAHATTQPTRTLGLLKSTVEAFEGYTLLFPLASKQTFLLDMCGRVVHTWTSDYTPGHTVRLLPNGNLVRMLSTGKSTLGEYAGGAVEIRDWDNNQIWYFECGNDSVNTHHGLDVLPNGNVIMNMYQRKTREQAIAAGIDTATVDSVLWSESVIEVQQSGPNSGTIVWQWNAWDHLVQDYDATKDNYEKFTGYPERIDINFPRLKPGSKRIDKWHANSVAYNADLDQIMISAHTSSEVWIIDHSTTTKEAAGSTGGRYGKGGGLLYRFGNDAAYGAGDSTSQILFGQHDPHWIPRGLQNEGTILVFNNGTGRPGRGKSSVEIYAPSVNVDGVYSMADDAYIPPTLVRRYEKTTIPVFFSPFVSNAQVLPNNNLFICSGISGDLFEINSNDSTIWRYQNPVRNDTILAQGTQPVNVPVFRAYRYGKDYPAFVGKDLSAGSPLERSPTSYPCAFGDVTLRVAMTEEETVNISPNPASEAIVITGSVHRKNYTIVDAVGRVQSQGVTRDASTSPISVSTLQPGYYVVIIDDHHVLPFIKLP